MRWFAVVLGLGSGGTIRLLRCEGRPRCAGLAKRGNGEQSVARKDGAQLGQRARAAASRRTMVKAWPGKGGESRRAARMRVAARRGARGRAERAG
eukprot:5885763-Pleurochrysis_carterae.AAC.2